MSQEIAPKRFSRREILIGVGGVAAGVAVASVSFGIGKDNASPVTNIIREPQTLPVDVLPVTEVERAEALADLSDFMAKYTQSNIVTKFMQTASPEEVKQAFVREKLPRPGREVDSGGELEVAWVLRLPSSNEVFTSKDFLNPDYFFPTVVFTKPKAFSVRPDGSTYDYDIRQVQVMLDKNGRIRQGVQRGFEQPHTVLTEDEMIGAFNNFTTNEFSDSIYVADDHHGFNVIDQQTYGPGGASVPRELLRTVHKPVNAPKTVLQGKIDFYGTAVLSESISLDK